MPITNEPVGATLRRRYPREERPARTPVPGGQRTTEDRARMAEEAAAAFDAEEAALMERRSRPRSSAITNEPVGQRVRGNAAPAARASSTRNQEAGEGSNEASTDQNRRATRSYAEPEYTSASRGAPRPRAARQESEADKLNATVQRLHAGEKPTTDTEKRLADAMGIAYKKGGLVKPKGHGKKEEAMEMKGGKYRGNLKEEMAEMKMKKGGKVMKKAAGGKIITPKAPAKQEVARPLYSGRGTISMPGGAKKYAKGGGIEIQGKTKGKMC